MTKFLTIIAFLIGSVSISAQNYGNEWIDYSQTYFKFKIYETGWHVLGYNEINSAFSAQGLNLSTTSADDLQIFGREKEVSIFVSDGGDNTIDPGDFLAFYAEKNDAWKDSVLFFDTEDMPDNYYSYFNDTIHYFLSIGSSGSRIMEESDINYTAYNNADFCWKTSYYKHVTTSYSTGPLYFNLSSPAYTRGEGWTAGSFKANNGNSGKVDTQVNTENAFTGVGAPLAYISSVATSASNPNTNNAQGYNHSYKIEYTNSNIFLTDTAFGGYDMIKMGGYVDPSTLVNGNTRVRHRGINIGQGNNEKMFLSSVTIDYPHTFDFENETLFKFGLNNGTLVNKQRITITNFNSTNPRLLILNDGIKEIPLTNNGGAWEAVIPNHSTSDSLALVMIDEVSSLPVSDLQPVNNTGSFTDFTSFNLANPFIVITHKKLMTPALDYGNYRSSLAGGGYDVLVADIEELYMQYAAGIESHPVSIRAFIADLINNWGVEPHLFLVGKSISNKADQSKGTREDVTSYHQSLVPTWGYPGSDNHITQGINNSGKSYAVPIGRLSATHAAQVYDYLNKVTSYENNQDSNSAYTIPNKEWQKRIVHFNGGNDSLELGVIGSFLQGYENIAEDTLFGADITRYTKSPTSVVLNSNDFFDVQQKLIDGISVMTFFGHASSGGGFSQNIDNPENWNNNGKFPYVIGLGCYTGDVHGVDTVTYTDRLIKTPDAGAVAFTSTVKLGFLSNIGIYSNLLYQNFCADNYYGTIGESMKRSCDTLAALQGTFWGISYESNYTGMSLQGDPALKTNYHEAPEIVLDPNRIWTNPAQIDLSVDTFDLNIVLTNIGSAFRDSFELAVERVTPEGQDSVYSIMLDKLLFRDTITFKIPTNPSSALGLNVFNITADLPISVIDEHADELNNNQLTFQTYISSNGLSPIWPYEYAIYPHDTVSLKSSTFNPFEPEQLYHFEIDTTDLFNSPFKKTQSLMSIGGVVEAAPDKWINANGSSLDTLRFTDSTVYFWRCAPDSTSPQWEESSFQYIPKKWGWGQAHFYQFKNNGYQGIDYNRNNRTFDLTPNLINVQVNTNISFVSSAEWNGTNWSLAGSPQDYGGWTTPSIMVAVLDGCTLENWCTDTSKCFGQFNSADCGAGYNDMGRNRCHNYFVFRYNQQDEMDSLGTFLNDHIPDGHYVIAYTYIPNNYTSPMNLNAAMPASVESAFQAMGATGISSTAPDDGWIFFGRKGFPALAEEVHTPNTIAGGNSYSTQPISLNTFAQGCEQGQITSEIAGPSKHWNALYWQQSALEFPTSDSTRLQLLGLDYSLNETLLLDTSFTQLDSILPLNNIIDASIYPMAKLRSYHADSTTFTPSQIDRWHLIYEPVPEFAINPKKGMYFSFNDSIQQGDSARFAVAIENVSQFDGDSLFVSYFYNQTGNNQIDINYSKQDSLKAGDVLLDTLAISTASLSSENFLWAVVNPYLSTDVQHQPEQFYFNNLWQKSFSIQNDDVNPVLDVTFDGVHILDKEIVSPKPFIKISLDDDSPFLLLDEMEDTAQFTISIRRPESNTYERIYFMNSSGEEILKFIPAEDSKNKSVIEYEPHFTEDGIYHLKVQGRDKSDNLSGDYDYEISFEVINASTITHIFNYPNPFSTSTRFVFTLTGDELPEQMLIQIMTVTGQVVREIDLAELGPLRTGKNITEYAWDGRDNFGDQLANGVYLYRVQAKINGEDIEHRSTVADQNSFKKGYGKMYLMR